MRTDSRHGRGSRVSPARVFRPPAPGGTVRSFDGTHPATRPYPDAERPTRLTGAGGAFGNAPSEESGITAPPDPPTLRFSSSAGTTRPVRRRAPHPDRPRRLVPSDGLPPRPARQAGHNRSLHSRIAWSFCYPSCPLSAPSACVSGNKKRVTNASMPNRVMVRTTGTTGRATASGRDSQGAQYFTGLCARSRVFVLGPPTCARRLHEETLRYASSSH